MVKESFPFKEKIISKNKKIRVFSNVLSENELKWHQDKEDRIIKVLNENDWMIQIDNKLPQKLELNQEIIINKNKWHRLIGGKTKNIFLEITTIKQ